ncbi:putative zinc-binding metallopeptidase [Stieleria sp. JC731]|uniref:putative zinc-binding metallopeptidase n=1 Tax=Pirellulaceae TaxID=2691357 RepID=UPI001E36FC25|nr:putative zinc-binding metallopeptidase [Stieleria sp. JC731]MCC9600649.1 putative zinc-binding metallopeptidase [Stieleria sp. JC731]
MSDDELLDMRICDLKLSIRDTILETRIDQLNRELADRGLKFRPHFWLSEDWFSPDGIPGIAIPFYLAHPRLCRLERKQLLEVEGGTKQWCMKILRHETGHAIDTAFQIRRKSRYRELFGKASEPYPEFYKPNPQTRDYVLHLEMWYAQAHPLEDFAETFAVWLPKKGRWKARYRNWPAIKKLEYVDDFMNSIAGKSPVVQSKQTLDPVSQIRRTLRTHYRRKREHYGMDYPNVYDKDLRKLFSCDRSHRRNPTAAALLSQWRGEIRRVVADWTGAYSYMVDQVLQEMIERCRELELRLGTSADVCKRDAMILVALRTSNYLNSGHRRVMM